MPTSPHLLSDLAQAVLAVRELSLFALLVGAVFTDIAYGKVPNWLTYTGIMLGLILAVAGPFAGLARPDAVDAIVGFAMAFGLFGAFYAMGWMGAGDAKLAAAIGMLKGWQFFLWALAYITLAGCILAVIVLIWRGRLLESFWNSVLFFFRPGKLRRKMEAEGKTPIYIPYGVAMGFGTMTAWLLA